MCVSEVWRGKGSYRGDEWGEGWGERKRMGQRLTLEKSIWKKKKSLHTVGPGWS